ncbi:Hypothetical predicted protein [Pelobates cultripes]|uniref:Uncharacterized protein n=1 Tax=Pelobates cultripes TaxID=61616 RepID=A0AAD1S129_PELCU|nr:Hypothetical predicted protein [Pelobates cultripes]
MADYEDRAPRNNLRLRGVPESISPEDLQVYVRVLLHTYSPDISADMLLVDRVHRVAKPKYLPDSTPRDVLLRAHYYHIKELVLRAHHSRPDPHEHYPSIRIMADLSAAMLRCRREFQQVTSEMRNQGIRYRWGFLTKFNITKNREAVIISKPEEGLIALKRWGFLAKLTTGATPMPQRQGRNNSADSAHRLTA